MKAAAWPDHCGRPDCPPATRMLEIGDDKLPTRCPCVRNAGTRADLTAERDRLTRRLADIDAALTVLDAPEWAMGPGGRRPP